MSEPGGTRAGRRAGSRGPGEPGPASSRSAPSRSRPGSEPDEAHQYLDELVGVEGLGEVVVVARMDRRQPRVPTVERGEGHRRRPAPETGRKGPQLLPE